MQFDWLKFTKFSNVKLFSKILIRKKARDPANRIRVWESD